MAKKPPRDDATVPAFSSPRPRPRQGGGMMASDRQRRPGARTFGSDARYEVVTQIGRGGFGTVYKAYDHRLAKHVAIKTINVSDIASTDLPDYIRHFDGEAKIAAQLEHPGIVTVLDYDPFAEEPFLVMPLVDGGTLRDWLAEHPHMPWPEAVALGVQVAEALQYAHTHGVQAHRDIKPGNIFCAGRVYKVGDFGIARKVAIASAATRSTFFAAGTPRYMAPEQITDPRRVDGRTDLFSLCAVLYEVLTGRPPFRGVTLDFDPEEDPASAERIVAAAFQPPVPIRRLAPEVPPPVARAIERGLERKPSDRFRDCAEFARILRSGGTGGRRRSLDPERRRVRNRRATLALIFLLAGVGYAFWPQLRDAVPHLIAIVRGGDNLTLARAAARSAAAPEFARDLWQQAEDRREQAAAQHSRIYRREATRLYWIAALHAQQQLITNTKGLAENSLAQEFAPESYTVTEAAWEEVEPLGKLIEKALVEGNDKALDQARDLRPRLAKILAGYQQAAVDASRRSRAAMAEKLRKAESGLESIRGKANPKIVAYTSILVEDARQALQAGNLPEALAKVKQAARQVDTVAKETLTITRARAEKARWDVADLRMERREVPPELVVRWERAEEKYQAGKKRLEVARDKDDVAAAEEAVKLFEQARTMLLELNTEVNGDDLR